VGQQASVFAPNKLFQPKLMIVGKAMTT